MISDPTTAVKLKRGQKEKIEGALSDAMQQLEVDDSNADDLRKKVRAIPNCYRWGSRLIIIAGTCFEAHRHQGVLDKIDGFTGKCREFAYSARQRRQWRRVWLSIRLTPFDHVDEIKMTLFTLEMLHVRYTWKSYLRSFHCCPLWTDYLLVSLYGGLLRMVGL